VLHVQVVRIEAPGVVVAGDLRVVRVCSSVS
jgi:hypothetical protein